MSVISALLRAERDLVFLEGCHATDRSDLLPDAPYWKVDNQGTLQEIRDALTALGVSSDMHGRREPL